jgi:bile acid-coenzyme A ligase
MVGQPTMRTNRFVAFGDRITQLASRHPDRTALICEEKRLTWSEYDDQSGRQAAHLSRLGVGSGDMVTIAVPNSLDWYRYVGACWKLGAIPQFASAQLPQAELAAIVELADSKVVAGVADPLDGRVCLPADYDEWREEDPYVVPSRISPAWKAPTSGGSTGRPKLIISGDPAQLDEGAGPGFPYMRTGEVHVMPGPLYHNAPSLISLQSLLWDNTVAVLRRFDAEQTLATIDCLRAHTVYLVPTMMKRILRLPEEVRGCYDLSSLRLVWHLAEPCPPWLKEAWMDWLGPQKVIEIYGGTESVAATVINGTEWLEHRGSVGRPFKGELRIGDDQATELPRGVEGEVWLRANTATPTYYYRGATTKTAGDGWESLGDIGWMDEDGYLYLCDRSDDMILVGGANVYPAEVEAAIQEHPAVRSCVVIGLPDQEYGARIHAIVEADSAIVSESDLLTYAAERLVAYKLPRTIEYVETALRDDSGKVRRSLLRNERIRV